MKEPGARSRISRAETAVSSGRNSLVSTSLSPEPCLRKMRRRPLMGPGMEDAAWTRKKTWAGAVWLGDGLEARAAAASATGSQRWRERRNLSMSINRPRAGSSSDDNSGWRKAGNEGLATPACDSRSIAGFALAPALAKHPGGHAAVVLHDGGFERVGEDGVH